MVRSINQFFRLPIQGLEKHQLDMIMRECHLAVFAFVVVSSLIYLLLRGGTDHWITYWYIGLTVIHLSEFVVIFLYKTGLIVPPDSPFFRVFVWIAGFLTGLLWSTFLFVLSFNSASDSLISTQALLLYMGILLIITAGSIYYLPAYVSLLCGLTLSPLLLLLFSDDPNKWIFIAVMIFMIMVHVSLVLASHNDSSNLYLEQEQNKKLFTEIELEKNQSQQLASLAEQSLEQKNLFIAAASHDLRQPLHAFGLYLEALKKHISTVEGNEIRDSMLISVENLNHSFSGLLDISKLDSGTVELSSEVFELREFLKSRLNSARMEAVAKDLELSFEGQDVLINADPIFFDRIVRNLVSNAIKFTDEGSVTVSWQVNTDKVVLTVEDSGCGIPVSEHELVFDEYYQVSPNQHSTGLGLGLSIVKRLCDMMGISITYYSVVGSGTKFTLVVPTAEAREFSKGQLNEETGNIQSHSIIVIDDDELVLQGMTKLLSGWGCDVLSAQNLEEVLREVTETDFYPTLIIADLQLQNGEIGTEAISALREEFANDIPALVISGDTTRSTLDKMSREQYRILTKPVLPNVLYREIQNVGLR